MFSFCLYINYANAGDRVGGTFSAEAFSRLVLSLLVDFIGVAKCVSFV